MRLPTIQVETRRVLPYLLGLAAVLRIGWWVWYVDIIENEGVEYARLAWNLFHGKGYVSIFGGTHTLFPPLYPLLIGLIAPLTGSGEVAARLVSLLAGLVVVGAVYNLAKEVFTPRVAFIAGAVAACHPLLIALSVSTYSEAPFIGISSAAALLTVRCLRRPSWKLAIGVGGLVGAAYLMRPEGILLAGPLAVLLLGGEWTRSGKPGRPLGHAALLTATAVLIGSFYVAHLSRMAGQFRWEGKSAINNLIVNRVSRGMTYPEASRGLGPNGEPEGPFLFLDQGAVLRQQSGGLGLTLHNLLRSPVEQSQIFLRIAKARFLGAPVIVGLALVGLLFSGWWRGRLPEGLVILAIPGVSVLGVLTLHWVWARYLFTLVPAMVIWAAAGLDVIGKNLRVLAVVLALGMIALSGQAVLRAEDLSQTRQADIREAGEWIRRDYQAVHGTQSRPKIATLRTALAYYADAELVYLPFADQQRALRFLHQTAPNYLAVRDSDTDVLIAPYVSAWLKGLVADSCAQPVTNLPGSAGAHYRIWRWTCGRNGKS